MKLVIVKKVIAFLSIVLSVTYSDIIYRVPIEGVIDLGLPPYIKRVIKEAEDSKVKAIVFEINTFGGRVDAATQIKDAILSSNVQTIGFINRRAGRWICSGRYVGRSAAGSAGLCRSR